MPTLLSIDKAARNEGQRSSWTLTPLDLRALALPAPLDRIRPGVCERRYHVFCCVARALLDKPAVVPCVLLPMG